MAVTPSKGWLNRSGKPTRSRSLIAAATRLNLGDNREARRQRALRQGWQLEAWAYRDSIAELRYAINYLANSMARMRIFPAAYTGSETDTPVALSVEMGAPQQLVDACDQALKDLGNGKMALAGLLHSLSTNLSTAGEAFLLGQEDPASGNQSWTIRSIDEIIVYNDTYKLREVPMDPQGILGWVDLDPALNVVSRMWQPHPRFRILADSPLRAMMDDCESLLMLRRMIRATARSRLAGRGILAIPDELSIAMGTDDDDDPSADPFMGPLTEHLTASIADEGIASSVVPLIVRGKGDTLAQIRLIDFYTQFDELALKNREDLIGIIATGFDLPKEVVTGMADLNHWGAFQVDDSTFRYHVEPHVITGMDCITSGFLHPYLQTSGLDPDILNEWLEKIVMWYDPTELVTHPDQTTDAFQLHDRIVISNEALRRAAGFSESDAPTAIEFSERLISKQRTWPANLSMEILHQNDPTLDVPPITVSGTVPGIKPGPGGGVDVGEPAALPAVTSPTEPPTSQAAPEPAVPTDASTPPVPPAATEPKRPGVTASGEPKKNLKRLSAHLNSIDRDLRTRLQTAANAALQRQLEKAGGRIRNKVTKSEVMRSKIAQTRNEHVASVLGRTNVEATGLTASVLMDSDFSTLKEQFYSWTSTAQAQALATAAQMAGLEKEDAALATAAAVMKTSLDAAWSTLESSLTQLAQSALYAPVEDLTSGESLVPTGVIRCALGISGGADVQDFGLVTTKDGASVPAIPLGTEVGADGTYIGQVATGSTLSDLLTQSGLGMSGYTWDHGMTLNAFEPHADLDGVEFATFDDPVLTNDIGFPDNAFFTPGDHQGCSCGAYANWDDGTDGSYDVDADLSDWNSKHRRPHRSRP